MLSGIRWAVLATILLGALAWPALAQDSSNLTVDDHGVGTDVVDHELTGRSDRFEEGSRVVFWTRVVGGAEGQRIRHVWIHEGQEVTSIGLTLGGSHWRTFSRKTLHPGSTGPWAAEVRDAEGRVLARSEFVCTPAGGEGAESDNSPEPTLQ